MIVVFNRNFLQNIGGKKYNSIKKCSNILNNLLMLLNKKFQLNSYLYYPCTTMVRWIKYYCPNRAVHFLQCIYKGNKTTKQALSHFQVPPQVHHRVLNQKPRQKDEVRSTITFLRACGF